MYTEAVTLMFDKLDQELKQKLKDDGFEFADAGVYTEDSYRIWASRGDEYDDNVYVDLDEVVKALEEYGVDYAVDMCYNAWVEETQDKLDYMDGMMDDDDEYDDDDDEEDYWED